MMVFVLFKTRMTFDSTNYFYFFFRFYINYI